MTLRDDQDDFVAATRVLLQLFYKATALTDWTDGDAISFNAAAATMKRLCETREPHEMAATEITYLEIERVALFVKAVYRAMAQRQGT